MVQSVVMLTDLEGVAGVVSFLDQTFPDARYFDHAKRLLTAEVNAAVDGLIEGGVEEVLVMDFHGPGAIWFEDLHPRARLFHGRPVPPWSRLAPIIAEHDAAVIIGQHAMAGTLTGNLHHTQSSRTIDYYRLNEQLIGETAQFALYCGELDVPVIFLSGDDAACIEVEKLIPGITTAAVKQGLGRGCAISLSSSESHSLIRVRIRVAVEKQIVNPLAPLKWPGPYTLQKRYFFTDDADRASSLPGSQRIDSRTVQFHGERIQDVIYV
ncbi:MAG: M55 family metallopeptidase [Anaerolineae bacterium]|nr:M55 family metallopeptidase [Anaerolineae bacterium]